MNSRQVLLDGAHCLRTAAAPLLTLGVLALARTLHTESPSLAGIDELLLVAWRAAVIATLLWFLVALIWAVTRPRRDRRAFQRLQHLRQMAAPPDRALVHVQTTVWNSTAGEYVVVVNVATGGTFRVWLPETKVPVGAFVVLERTDSGVSVVDWLSTAQVDAGHRHEQRIDAGGIPRGSRETELHEPLDHGAALRLIEETERFLKEQEYR